MTQFMKSYQPIKVVRDKNNSSGMNYVMHPDKKEQREENTKKLTIAQPQTEKEYEEHLVSLVLTRMEDKHRNMTDVFRFMDQRGRNKVNKKDFATAVERMRISISREDVTKIWNHLDAQNRGFILLGDLFDAFGKRVNNFGKSVETAV